MVTGAKLKELQERKRLITSRDEVLRSVIRLDCEQVENKATHVYAGIRPYLPLIAGSAGFLTFLYRRQLFEVTRRMKFPQAWLRSAARKFMQQILS